MNFIGPRRALGWNKQIGYQEQFGDGPAAFKKGPGTLFPFPSIPLSQAFRYWWAATQWRIQINLMENDGGTIAYDSGWINYLVGIDQGRLAFVLNGYGIGNDPISLNDRYGYGAPAGGPFLAQFLLGNGNNGLYNILNSFSGGTGFFLYAIQLMGEMYCKGFEGDPSLGGLIASTKFGLVWDEDVPGNVFMAFFFGNNDGDNLVGVSTLLSPSAAHSLESDGGRDMLSATLSLDGGIPIPLYGFINPADSNGQVTGTITIDTKDS